MKKEYKAPRIAFESFAASTNIAGDCEKATHTPSQMQCGLEVPGGITLFLDGIQDCFFKQSDMPFDGFCYHIPTETMTYFNS